MSWSTKTKVNQSDSESRLLTPDGQEILVGADEDEILLLWEAYSYWNLKSRVPQPSWSLKTKVSQ